MKRKTLIIVGSVLVVALFGCNSKQEPSPNSSTETVVEGTEEDKKDDEEQEAKQPQIEKCPIKIEELDWHMEPGIINAHNRVMFSYTNNSNYTILEFDMNFSQKLDTTSEQREAFEVMKTEAGWTDEDIQNAAIYAENKRVADPGETVEGVQSMISNSIRYVTDIAQYNIMEPSLATLIYIGKDEKVHKMYYDYKNDAYSETSDDIKEIFEWPNNEIATHTPKPDNTIVQVTYSSDDYFTFDILGTTTEDFTTYVEKCKAAGFTEDLSEYDDSYRAKDASGYEISVSYMKEDETIDVGVTI